MNLILSVLVISSISGLVTNGYILLVLLWQRRFHTANQLLLLHLATVDTLFCFLILLVNTTLSLIRPQSLDPELQAPLQLQGILWTVFPAVIMWTICAMSLDRYATVCYPFTHGKLVNRSRAGLLIVTAWIISLCLSVMPLLGLCSYRFTDARLTYSIQCVDRKFFSAELTFSLILVTCNFLLPLLITVATQLHILVIARSQRGKIVSALSHQSQCFGQKSGHDLPAPWNLCKGRSGFALVSLLLASFICLWMPTSILTVTETVRGRDVHPVLVSGATVLFSLIPSVNAYIYGVKSRLLRQTFKRLLQRYLYQHQASLEIERRISLRSQSSTRFSLAWHSLTHPSALPANLLSQRALRRYSAPVISVTEPEPSPATRSPVRRYSTHTLLLTSATTTTSATISHQRPLESRIQRPSDRGRSPTFQKQEQYCDSWATKNQLSPIQEVAQTCSSELPASPSGSCFL
jgi:hypothetical protein